MKKKTGSLGDQTRSPLSRTDRALAVALALRTAAAQSDPAEDWAPTGSADQSDLPEDRASTPAPVLQGAPSLAAAAASAPAPTLALASAPARATLLVCSKYYCSVLDLCL